PSITMMSLDDWRRQQAVNVEGVFLGIKHSLPLMRKAGNGGSIVNMSSVAGLKGSPILAAYCATKGAVRLFTKAIAMECANFKDGIRVNSVHPGIIETPIWLSISGMGQAQGTNAPPDLDAMSQQAVPLGVKGVPQDIANGVLWLASDESRTGHRRRPLGAVAADRPPAAPCVGRPCAPSVSPLRGLPPPPHSSVRWRSEVARPCSSTVAKTTGEVSRRTLVRRDGGGAKPRQRPRTAHHKSAAVA